MKSFLIIGYMFCFFVALIIFFQSLNNAFKKSILWGGIFLLFPIGSYFYYKKFIEEEKKAAISISTFIGLGIFSFLIAKFM